MCLVRPHIVTRQQLGRPKGIVRRVCNRSTDEREEGQESTGWKGKRNEERKRGSMSRLPLYVRGLACNSIVSAKKTVCTRYSGCLSHEVAEICTSTNCSTIISSSTRIEIVDTCIPRPPTMIRRAPSFRASVKASCVQHFLLHLTNSRQIVHTHAMNRRYKGK